MPVMINPRRKKRRKVKRKVVRRKTKRKTRSKTKRRKRNLIFTASGKPWKSTSKRRRKTKRKSIKRRKGGKVAKKRKKRRGRRRVPKTLPVFVAKPRRRKRKNPSTKRRKRRTIYAHITKGRLPIRRYRRRAVISTRRNPKPLKLMEQAGMVLIGMLGNTIVSGFIGTQLGYTIPFLQNKIISSGAISALAALLLGKKQPLIVLGSVAATGLEVAKFILPEDIKAMVGLGQIVLPYEEQYLLAGPEGDYENELEDIPASEIEGFAPYSPDIADIPASEIEGFAPNAADVEGIIDEPMDIIDPSYGDY